MKKVIILGLGIFAFANVNATVTVSGVVKSVSQSGGNTRIKCKGKGDCVVVEGAIATVPGNSAFGLAQRFEIDGFRASRQSQNGIEETTVILMNARPL